jgi:hypothetical protein
MYKLCIIIIEKIMIYMIVKVHSASRQLHGHIYNYNQPIITGVIELISLIHIR